MISHCLHECIYSQSYPSRDRAVYLDIYYVKVLYTWECFAIKYMSKAARSKRIELTTETLIWIHSKDLKIKKQWKSFMRERLTWNFAKQGYYIKSVRQWKQKHLKCLESEPIFTSNILITTLKLSSSWRNHHHDTSFLILNKNEVQIYGLQPLSHKIGLKC